MGRLVDVLAGVLLIAAALAFSMGLLPRADDNRYAVYWLVMGAVSLKGCVDLVRPRRAR